MQGARRRRLRASRLHHRQGPAVRAAEPRRRHPRRALAPDARAGRRGCGEGAPGAAAALPDRVRHPVAARPDPGRELRQAGGVPRRRRAHGLRQPARAVVLAVPDVRRQAARVQAQPLRRLRERAAHEQGAQEAGLQGVPAPARGRELRRLGRAVGSRAAAARTDRGGDRGRPAGREHALRQAQDAADHRHRRVRAARPPSRRPALPGPLDLAVRHALLRRRRPRLLGRVLPGHPSDFRRSYDWGLDPVGRSCAAADSPHA